MQKQKIKQMKRLRENSGVLLVFLISFIILLPRTYNYCHLIKNLNFDSQNLFLWSYLPSMGILPIKDTFYPHGIFFYYIANHPLLLVIYLILGPLYFSVIFLSFKKLHPKNPLVYILSFVIFFLLATSLLTPRTFNRYGMLIASSALFALIHASKVRNYIKGLLLGAIAGFSISASFGIGVNISLNAIILSIFSLLIIGKEGRKQKAFNLFSGGLLGLLLGLIPLFSFIKENNALTAYVDFIKNASLMTIYAKSQMIIVSKKSFLIIGTSILQVILVLKVLFKTKKKDNFYYYLLISSTLSHFLLVYKFIIRQMPSLLIVSAIYSWLVLGFSFLEKLFVKKDAEKAMKVGLVALLLLTPYISKVSLSPFIYLKDFKSGFGQLMKGDVVESRMCDFDNFEPSNFNIDTSYFKVQNFVNDNIPDSKIFSYPYDPLYYLLFEQFPPPYPNIYEASPPLSQQKNINYLVETPVDVIIYNLKAEAVDDVPEYIRGLNLTRYILLHNKPYKYIEPFVLFTSRLESERYFLHDSNIVKEFSHLSEMLLNADFGSVFYTEGLHKSRELLEKGEVLFSAASFTAVNSYLEENDVLSKDLFLLASYQDYVGESVRLKIESGDIATSLEFRVCKKHLCLIHLDSIPLFYEPARLSQISASTEPNKISIVKLDDQKNYYW